MADLLQIIPIDNSQWNSIWQIYDETYGELRKTFFPNFDEYEDLEFRQNEEIPGLEPEVLRKITIDLTRTNRQMRWITQDNKSKAKHLRVLQRILYIFSRANPQGYIQGFHELLLPLYFVCFFGGTEMNLKSEYIESISYFMLHGLINGTPFCNFFTEDIDVKFNQIVFKNVSSILEKVHKPLNQTLIKNKVSPELYCFSWITVLFSQIYDLPRLLHLWDFIFSDFDGLIKNIVCLIVAHILTLKDQLLKKDFIEIMKVFHHMDTMNEFIPLKISKHLIDNVHLNIPKCF